VFAVKGVDIGAVRSTRCSHQPVEGAHAAPVPGKKPATQDDVPRVGGVRYNRHLVTLQPTGWGTPFDVINAVRRVNKLLRRRFDRSLYGLFISYAQYEVLHLLAGDRNLHAAAVARELRVSPQAVQKLLDKLALGGLVDLLPPDGGVIGLRITDDGRTRLRLAREALRDTSLRIEHVPIEERTALVAALGSVERALARPLDGNYL